jgi:hypothetical protein
LNKSFALLSDQCKIRPYIRIWHLMRVELVKEWRNVDMIFAIDEEIGEEIRHWRCAEDLAHSIQHVLRR